MSVLTSLGIDHTIFIQFLMFGAVFFIMTYGVFGPYAKALEERELRTKGGEGAVDELAKQTDELRGQYETRARKVSSDIKTIFDGFRSEASKEQEKLVSEAKSDAQRLVDQAKAKIQTEVTQAQAKLKQEIPGLAQLMVSKLLSKKV